MTEPVNRILWENDEEVIDEIVITDCTVHAERMDNRCWWIGIDLANGGHWAGNFFCDSRGRMQFTEQEMEGFEWDRIDVHGPDEEAP